MHRTHAKTRPGFTLIEMLVVISIIIALAALTIQVAGTIFNTARRARTSALLAKIEAKIKSRQENFARLNLKKFEPIAKQEFSQDFNVTSPRQVKLLAHKLAFKRAFPQTWQELSDTLTIAQWQDVMRKLGRDPLPPQNPPTLLSPTVESSEVLLFVLTQDELLGVPAVDADEFSESEIGDLDEDGIKEFIDGWGRPLRFYRWPTRLIRPDGVIFVNNKPQGAPITPLQYNVAQTHISSLPKTEEFLRDRDDPLGTMRSLVRNLNDVNLLEYNTNVPGRTLHTPFTYHTPLVVSAGSDGDLGLFEPADIANFGHLAAYPQQAQNAMLDNMTNQNLRAGGQ